MTQTSMYFSRQAIHEFQLIYEEECGAPLSDEEAEEMALRVLRVFEILDKPADPLTDSDGTLP